MVVPSGRTYGRAGAWFSEGLSAKSAACLQRDELLRRQAPARAPGPADGVAVDSVLVQGDELVLGDVPIPRLDHAAEPLGGDAVLMELDDLEGEQALIAAGGQPFDVGGIDTM